MKNKPRRLKTSLLTLAVLFGSSAAPAFLSAASGKVIAVAEGDLLTVQADGQPENIRLHGVDSPGKGQTYFRRARLFTSDMTLHKTVEFTRRGKDAAGRTLAEVRLPDGRSFNKQLVRAGWAWWDRRQAPDDEELKDWEEEARAKQRGLWREKNPTPPWESK